MADKQKCSREMAMWMQQLRLIDPVVNKQHHRADPCIGIDLRWSVLTQRDKSVGIECVGHRESARHINISRDIVNRFLTNMRNAK